MYFLLNSEKFLKVKNGRYPIWSPYPFLVIGKVPDFVFLIGCQFGKTKTLMEVKNEKKPRVLHSVY